MKQGGFSLGKWQSNAPELIDDEEGEAIKAIADNAEPLSMSWDSKNDNFVFPFDKEKVEKAVETPRQLVSVQASIYYPLGFLTPFCFIETEVATTGNFRFTRVGL